MSKQLSKRAAVALEALKAGGAFWTGMAPSYSGYGLGISLEIRTVLMDAENARIKGVGVKALEELEAAGIQFDLTVGEMMGDVRRLKATEVVS